MLELEHQVERPRPCSYLPGRAAAIEYRVLLDVSPAELGEMLVRGWRRFGPAYFRPACAGCSECVSLRLSLRRFVPTRSQERALRRSRRFRVEWAVPSVDAERLELYRAWHASREAARQWDASDLDEAEYGAQFAFPHPAARELSWRDAGGRLVAVGLVDRTPRGLSAVYFYYHPEIARLSPGVANVLQIVEAARRERLPHVYLGYRVLGCASLAYKALFRPHELLAGRPGADEEPAWNEAAALAP